MDTGSRCVILFFVFLISDIVICYPRHHEANEIALRTEEKTDKTRSFLDSHYYFEKNEDNQNKQQKRQSEKIEVRGGIKSGKQIVQLTSADMLDTEHLDPDDPMDPLIASMRKMDNGQSSQATSINREWNKHRFNQPGPEMIVEDSNNEVMKRDLDKFSRKWPKKIVPYEVNKMSLVQTKTYRVIEKAVEVMSKLTCVQWRPKSSELAGIVGHDNYVSFITGNGCMSDVGYVESSPQFIILKETGDLTSGCISQETILHEMMHVMGFVHEQTRFDRDQYININWENVKEDEKPQFQKIMTDVSSPYDLESLMQYGLTDFSKNGNQTMEPKDKNLEFLVDSGKTLSFYDVLDITTAYGCADHCQSPPSCQNGGFVNKDCQCYCPKGLTGTTCEIPVTDPDCGGVIEIENIGKEITLQSPSYPDIYPAGKICRWVLKVPDRLYVRLTIEDLHLTGSVTNACYHWLEVQYNLPGQTGMRLCGDIGGETITASKDSPNLMILTFDSTFAEYRLRSKGFRVLFSAVGPGCKDDPCVNGRCKEEDLACNFTCICEPGYTGRLCDKVDENGIFTCSFETYEHCFLKNTPDGDSFDWTSSFGITSTRGTGPSGAFKGNMYLLAEMSEPRTTGDKALLVSSLDFKERVRCLKFHYHMFGRSMGSLNVYINGNETNRTELWSKSGNQGFDWLEALVDIPATTGLKIMIEAIRGDDIYSDIALDDVRLIPGKCDHNEPRECLMTARGTEYKGRLNITMSGQTCTAWSLHKKHTSLAGDSNYCRNPDMEELPWCYTATDNDEDWDLCYIPQCNPEECRRSQNGYDYQGTISVTESGLPCQRWDSQTPHQHNFLGLAGHENYCRNPDGEQRLWCITMDEEIKIDFCDIPICESPAEECRKTIFGIDYFGNVSTTKSGKTCQRWDSQIPHSHDYSIVEDQENYCRNPNGREDKPWCYTTDSDTETEYCDIGLCEDSPCYPNPCKNGGKCSTNMGGYKCECFFGFTGDTCESTVNSSPAEECRRSEIGYEYKGTKSTTKTGRVCQKWGETSPHSHEFTSLGDQENYCRNPDRDPRGLWCITTDPNRVYDYCDIPLCNSPALECKTNTGGNDYFGRVNVTVSGNTCQRWDNQTPSPHPYTYLADQENYCRNPDGDKTPWCISTNPYKQWEYCSIPDCCELSPFLFFICCSPVF